MKSPVFLIILSYAPYKILCYIFLEDFLNNYLYKICFNLELFFSLGSVALNSGVSSPRANKNGANSQAGSHVVTDFVLVNETSKMAAKTNGANTSSESRERLQGGAATAPILENGAGAGGSNYVGEGAKEISDGGDKGERLSNGGGGGDNDAGGRGKESTKDSSQHSNKDDDSNPIYDKVTLITP